MYNRFFVIRWVIVSCVICGGIILILINEMFVLCVGYLKGMFKTVTASFGSVARINDSSEFYLSVVCVVVVVRVLVCCVVVVM